MIRRCQIYVTQRVSSQSRRTGGVCRLTPLVLKGARERRILDVFVALRLLDSEHHREVRVGRRRFQTPQGEMDWRKSVDLVCNSGQRIPLLEPKVKLNYQALGEILTLRDPVCRRESPRAAQACCRVGSPRPRHPGRLQDPQHCRVRDDGRRFGCSGRLMGDEA